MSEQTCIFCKIANGEIPSKTIYEDAEFKAFLDVNPVTKGHVLIVPKEHYKDLIELPDSLSTKILIIAKKIAKHMMKALNCDGINLIQNNGKEAGQTVFHFHLHIIPRYANDESKDFLLWNTIKLSEDEINNIEKNLKIIG